MTRSSIATCDHWHAPVALAAILAGKHVYVEKPCSHNVRESNLLVRAARAHKKCVQHGTQRRSWSQIKATVQALRDGVIGTVFAAKAIVGSGGQLFYDDDHETPDTQTVIYDYAQCQLIYEMRLWTPYAIEGHDNATVFYGTAGKLEDGRAGVVVTAKDAQTKKAAGDRESNMEDFLNAVRANDPAKLSAPIEVGAISANLCHLGNIGTRLGGQRVEYDSVAQKITRCGGREPEANALLTRRYRAGYELPYKG